MLAHSINTAAYLHHQGLKTAHRFHVTCQGGIIQVYIQFREHIGTSIDASVSTQ